MCGYSFRGKVCRRKGAHYCEPRADRAVQFIHELLVHTKGPYARKQFLLEPWQEADIVRPLFGEVQWSTEWAVYVRRYQVAYIVLARKNGKSELVAALCLLLLVGDDEESAEIYGAAKDTKQARKVWEPAERMKQLSPVLDERLAVNKNEKRIYDERSASYLEVITADAAGELGHNPHGFYLDEALSQRDGSLWDAMRTAAGARLQPLFLVITTETNDPSSWGAGVIDEAERIQEDPSRSPHTFAYVRVTPKTDEQLATLRKRFRGHPDLPVSCDPWDERNWRWANPALGTFLSIEALRKEALDAKNEPSKENSFRQFRLNQRVQQITRWMPLHLWDASSGPIAATPEWHIDNLYGQKCWAGLDLSARFDLTAWCLRFESGHVLWRCWVPRVAATALDRRLGGQLEQWAKAGWITITDGETIDYESVYEQIERDHGAFAIASIGMDPWSGEPVAQEIHSRIGIEPINVPQTFSGLSGPMQSVMKLVKDLELLHGGNPVARWNVDSVVAKSATDNPDLIRPVKPIRQSTDARIDLFVALLCAESERLNGSETAAPFLSMTIGGQSE